MARRSQLKNSEYHLRPAEIKKVIYAAKTFRDRCLIKALAQTGIRRAEVANLDIRDVDFTKRLAEIREGKGGKSRTIPITDELASDLKHLIGGRKTGPVFQSNRAGPLTLRQVNWIVAAAGDRSGVKNPNPAYSRITCHLFRHSFAREWKRRGGSIESLSKILGHTSIKTTLDEYGTEDLETVRENYSRVLQEMF
jgi:integrase/recombinase XerD